MHLPRLDPALESVKSFVHTCEALHPCVLDVDLTCGLIFPDFQFLLVQITFMGASPSFQQVVQLVQVELDHVALKAYFKSVCSLHLLFQLEKLLETPWDQAVVLLSSRDSECLSRAGLAVCKNTDVIAI